MLSSTKWCLKCGGEFVATVAVCPDCELELVEDRPIPELEATDAAGGEIDYDLAEWAGESRVMLEQLLEGDAIPHAWQGSTLTVPAAFETRADHHIDHVESVTRPPLDPDAEQIAYDLSDWTDEHQTRLEQRLVDEGIGFSFDVDGDLVVLASDEAAVEALIDQIEFPDALEVPSGAEADDPTTEPAGGVDAGTLLSDLFVAADRLMHDARDHTGVLAMVDAAVRASAIDLPYGFDPEVWRRIMALVDDLRQAFEGDGDLTDDEIETRAGELRAELRPIV